MGDGDSGGGVLVRIDADTAAYIAKLSRMAEGHEKVTKHAEGWGDAVEHVIAGFGKALVPLAVIETVVESVEAGLEGWNKQIERAGVSAQVVVDKLRRTTAQTGETREQVSDQILNQPSTLSIQQRQAAFAAFRGAAPGSATSVAPSEIIRRSGQAEIAGYDPEQIAGMAGSLHGVFGGDSFDAAALLQQRTGDQAGTASEMLRRLAAKAGPNGARELAPYLLASAQAGDKRFSVLNGLVGSYNPAFGSLGDYVKNGRFRVGADQRGSYDAIMRNMPQAEGDIANVHGFVERRAQGALEDESVRSSEETKYFNSQADVEEYQKEGARAERRELKTARRRLNSVEDPTDAAIMPNIHEGIQRVTGRFRGTDEAERAVDSIAGKKSEEHLEAIRNATTDRRLRNDVHGEEAK